MRLCDIERHSLTTRAGVFSYGLLGELRFVARTKRVHYALLLIRSVHRITDIYDIQSYQVLI
jgi:hypothetical protein